MALSRFCRVAPNWIRMLDLRQRIPDLTLPPVVGFEHGDALCPRFSSHRVSYAFCPSCLADQPAIHVPWQWSMSCLSRCAVHRRLLLEKCPACGQSDPLTFTGPDCFLSILCRSCGGYLNTSTDASADMSCERDIHAVENDYRASILGVAPVLLPNTTARAFRMFIEEMLHLLRGSLNRCSRLKSTADLFSRQDVLAIIAALILNAAPSPNQSVRSRCGMRGLRLWGTLLSVISEHEGATMERTSIRWPVALRRRFLSGLYYSTRKRWPYTPYRAATRLGMPVERSEVTAVFDLVAETKYSDQNPADSRLGSQKPAIVYGL